MRRDLTLVVIAGLLFLAITILGLDGSGPRVVAGRQPDTTRC
ncbi:MAG: hypothetical protein WKF75_09810 [Singulisphaera sp.]